MGRFFLTLEDSYGASFCHPCICSVYKNNTFLRSTDVDLVVHAAGPFQQTNSCPVLVAAIATKVRKGNWSMHLFNFIISEEVLMFSMLTFVCLARVSIFSLGRQQQTAYVDVCDDTDYAFRAKSFSDKAISANIPAITTGGIYPGVSNGLSQTLVINSSPFSLKITIVYLILHVIIHNSVGLYFDIVKL